MTFSNNKDNNSQTYFLNLKNIKLIRLDKQSKKFIYSIKYK